ncbi:DUF2806 domain-containing protein [uncultured Bacteroides sp.]|uniref:DUF2806 domain-containing protein n=1 Tax=uncultured Bacteroides sp. TaxID=162156 RepID=UPI00280BA12D|nr:DUF2806 domain-containing protein [uncultured Bacteroides sp.]
MGSLVDVSINTNGIAKLGELICNATGITAAGIKKNADAECYKRLLMAKAENIISQGNDNAIDRFIYAQTHKKLDNILQVSQKVFNEFTEQEEVSSEKVDQDWATRFFNIVEDISDEEMQNLWAKILAGEIKQPKSFSLRTLEVLRNISKEEAEAFIRNAPYCLDNCLCAENNFIKITDYLLLVDAGLIAPHEDLVVNITIDKEEEKLFVLKLGNRVLCLSGDRDKIEQKRIKIYSLTKAGSELLRLSIVEPSQECVDYFIDIFRNNGATRITEHKVTAIKGNNFDFGDEPIKVHFDSSL